MMKKEIINMKKQKKLVVAAITLLSASGVALADNTAPPTAPAQDSGRMVTAIQELGNRIEALAKASVKSVNEVAYQLDKSFGPTMQLNVKQQDIQNHTRTQTQVNSSLAVKRNLQPFSANTLTYTNKSQPEVKKVTDEGDARQKYINQLKNLEASDTIYSLVQGMEVSKYWTKKNLGNPGHNDDAFNFSAFIEPEVYSPEQVKNSENFIGYATKDYQSYSDDINLTQLRNALLKYQRQGTTQLSQQINQFRNNDAYKNYQLAIRSLVANKSVATDILSGLAAERKPIITATADTQLDAISRAIGVEPQVISMKNDAGENVSFYRYASPMQVAKFRANYRLNSPQWYQEVAGDSAENLQRKSVVLLAEISSQLYQNHLDNEKMMGALAMINLQASETTSALLKLQVKDVNAAISSFAAGASGSAAEDNASTSTSPSNSTTAPAQSTTQYDQSQVPAEYQNTPPPTTTPTP